MKESTRGRKKNHTRYQGTSLLMNDVTAKFSIHFRELLSYLTKCWCTYRKIVEWFELIGIVKNRNKDMQNPRKMTLFMILRILCPCTVSSTITPAKPLNSHIIVLSEETFPEIATSNGEFWVSNSWPAS
jgi:hypothetical protein